MCDGVLLRETSLPERPLTVNVSSVAVVCNVMILQELILDWKIWGRAPPEVWETLLTALEVLVRSNHPHQEFNLLQFSKAQVVQRLLVGCQVRVTF